MVNLTTNKALNENPVMQLLQDMEDTINTGLYKSIGLKTRYMNYYFDVEDAGSISAISNNKNIIVLKLEYGVKFIPLDNLVEITFYTGD